MLRPRGLCRPRLARRPTPAFHRALAICRLQPRRTPRIQNNSGLPQGPAGASAAASACGKLHFAGFGRARRGCMLDMRRRAFITLLGGAAATLPLAARGQQPSLPVIGILAVAAPEANAIRLSAFREGLRTAGYIEGQNVKIEYRWAEAHTGRLPELAAGVGRDRVAGLVAAGGTPSAVAAKAATREIPVVFGTGADPVEVGLVASLNRPGGNVTGVTALNLEVAPKRLELMHELLPSVTSMALLVNPAVP